VHAKALPGFDMGEVLRLAACAEAGSSHPLAAAIVGLAAAQGAGLSATVTHSEAVAGQVRACSCS